MLQGQKLNKKPIKIKRALISVFDKKGIIPLAKTLHKNNVEILSTGGTAATIRKANIPVIDVSDYTGFPEIMEGRIKTINPLVCGGILGLRDYHKNDAEKNKIKWIDLVVCNLYPFSKAIRGNKTILSSALENIDIGGPAMIRAAAKNIGWTCVVVDSNDYSFLKKELETKEISFDFRKKLSAKAFGHTAQYDSIVYNFLHKETLPNHLLLSLEKHSGLRYGENPHQSASSYKLVGNKENNVLNAKIHQGKQLSYNNIMDADEALACVREFDSPACVVIKHSNPCGAAESSNIYDSYLKAFKADSLSAFGGVVALNRTCTKKLAEKICSVFIEIILAPFFERDALELLKSKKNLRVLEIGRFENNRKKIELRNIDGGLLLQETDKKNITSSDLNVVTKKKPSQKDIETALFAWKTLKHAKSNGILIAKNKVTVGLGAGQVSRVDAVHMAKRKGEQQLKGSVLVSDAFFPFRDSIDAIKDSGIKFVLQPGGSIRDKEVVKACNEHKISMAFTGIRCFKH